MQLDVFIEIRFRLENSYRQENIFTEFLPEVTRQIAELRQRAETCVAVRCNRI